MSSELEQKLAEAIRYWKNGLDCDWIDITEDIIDLDSAGDEERSGTQIDEATTFRIGLPQVDSEAATLTAANFIALTDELKESSFISESEYLSPRRYILSVEGVNPKARQFFDTHPPDVPADKRDMLRQFFESKKTRTAVV